MKSELEFTVEEIATSMAKDPTAWAKLYLQLKETMELQRVLIDRLESTEPEITH